MRPSGNAVIISVNELLLTMMCKLKNQALTVSVGNITPEVNVWDVFLNA